MNSTALIEINILDVNDNSPKFIASSCNVTIAENVATPRVILKVEAKDADLGPNGEVHYSIVTSTSALASLFSMDYDRGELTLRQPLDPKHSPYSLLIRAKDSGQPAMSTTEHCYVNVSIFLIDQMLGKNIKGIFKVFSSLRIDFYTSKLILLYKNPSSKK